MINPATGRQFRATHVGWLGLCPIKIDMSVEDEPFIQASTDWLEGWLTLQIALQEWILGLNPDYEGGLHLRLLEVDPEIPVRIRDYFTWLWDWMDR